MEELSNFKGGFDECKRRLDVMQKTFVDFRSEF